MKKMIVISLLVLVGCQNTQSLYNEEETKKLKSYEVYEQASQDCAYPESVKTMLHGDFNKTHVKAYCGLRIKKSEGVNELIEAALSQSDIEKYIALPNFHADKVARYIAYPAKQIKEKVKMVNMDMDIEPYSITTIINDDSDMSMLVNKFNALPDGYIPQDLREVNYVCQQGVHYSCSTMDKMQLRNEAADAYERFVVAAQAEEINIVAIATYRSYAYQQSLYNYYKHLEGIEYADQYYARPGQSEHNSGLAVDITFNDHRYDEIEKYEGYDWILNHMHEYGFILRYPEDKQDLTRYGYESWHLRYVGKKAAKTIYDNKWCLEEYYGAI